MSGFETSQVVTDTGGLSLQAFLLTRLQPWRSEIMLENQGIRVKHQGSYVDPLTLDTHLAQNDVVFIDPAYGRTWMELRRQASSDFRDLVFCPQRVTFPTDKFLHNTLKALLSEPRAVDIPPGEADTLPNLIPKLIPLGRHPIRHLILVAHANPFGDIQLPVWKNDIKPDEEDESKNDLNWETLTECIAKRSLRIDGVENSPIVQPRPEDGNGKPVPCAVIIRGCSSGMHRILLERIQQAFGPAVDMVVMPRHFDAADFIAGIQNPALIEYFEHRFIVTSTTALDRPGVIEAFKKAGLKDWQGNRVPDSDWEALVPQNISRAVDTKTSMVRIDGRSPPAPLRAHFDPKALESMTVYMEHKTEPTADEIKEFIVKRWKNLPAFNDPDWPFWKRMGFGIKNDKAFIGYWNYQLNPAPRYKAERSKGRWGVRAMRFSFEVRTPLTDGGRLICRYIPNGESGTASNNIDYNDDRVFGCYKHIPPHFAQEI
jgi:hypothetical protein